jgi:5-methylcytosine-specific restriction endonuclease McrA
MANPEYIGKLTKHQLKGETEEQHQARVAKLEALGYRGTKQIQYRIIRDKFKAKHVKYGGWYECNHCHKWTQAPEVDHIIKRSIAPDRVLDPTNLQILCWKCHQIKDNGMKF